MGVWGATSQPSRRGEQGGEGPREEERVSPRAPLTLCGRAPVADWMGRGVGGEKDSSEEVSWGSRGGSAVGSEALPSGLTSGTALRMINSWPSYFLMKVTTDTSA